jgi:hypothetical protein
VATNYLKEAMQELESKDFDGLMLSGIYDLKDKEDALEKYPNLKKYPEFTKEVSDFNRVLKYIAFVYDKNTPLHVINNIMARKIEAANLAGLDKDDEEYPNIIGCRNPLVSGMIIRYIRMHKDLDYSEYTVANEAYYNQQGKLLSDDTSTIDKTKDLIANSKELRIRIDILRQELLNNDSNKNLERELEEAIEEEQLMIRPELIAKLIKEEGLEKTNSYLKKNGKNIKKHS